MEHKAVHFADRPHTRFAIVPSVVRPFNRVALENQGGKLEAEPALPPVPFALRIILIEVHPRILRR